MTTIKTQDGRLSEFGNILNDALENLDLDPDKFAFLALTSKVEQPIRDEIAFYLHQEYGDKYATVREWHRHDLALLNKEDLTNPLAIIEIKNYYSCDLLQIRGNNPTSIDGVLTDLSKDRDKMAKAPHRRNAKIYSILVLTNVQTRVPQDYETVIKYPRIINNSFRQIPSPETIEEIGKNHFINKVEREVAELMFVSNNIVGTAFGMGCSFSFFILKY